MRVNLQDCYVQDVDNQEDEASHSPASQDPNHLPVVPLSPQDRQAVLARAPADLAATLKAAADKISNSADAEVNPLVPMQSLPVHTFIGKHTKRNSIEYRMCHGCSEGLTPSCRLYTFCSSPLFHGGSTASNSSPQLCRTTISACRLPVRNAKQHAAISHTTSTISKAIHDHD